MMKIWKKLEFLKTMKKHEYIKNYTGFSKSRAVLLVSSFCLLVYKKTKPHCSIFKIVEIGNFKKFPKIFSFFQKLTFYAY